MLIPFIKVVIACLLLVTIVCMFAGVARIHMGILAFLSAGLLISLSMFQREWEKMKASRESDGADDSAPRTGGSEKTD